MYCVFNATTTFDADTGHPFGWPLESNYGYFCDQRDKGLFMLSNGFLNLIAIVGLYLVTVLYVGPKFMHNKKPLEVKNLIRLYNGLMILFNLYLIKRAMKLVDNGRSFFNCKGVELDLAHVDEIATITELFLLSRLADFLDTICNYCGKSQTAALMGSLVSAVIFLVLFYSFYQQAYNGSNKKQSTTNSNGLNKANGISCSQEAAKNNGLTNASLKKAE